MGGIEQGGAEVVRIRQMPLRFTPDSVFRTFRLGVLCLIALAHPGGVSHASAQDERTPDQPVLIEAGSIGVGELARLGDWAGIEIIFEDTHESQRELIIQIEGEDADGDSPLFQRTVTSNPGSAQRTWLYLWIPGSHGSQAPFSVSVYEAIEQDAGISQRTGVAYRRGELIARKEIGGRRSLLPAEVATGLVVGRRVGGLADYSRTPTGGGSSAVYLPNGHEMTVYAGDLAPDDLPDRAIGLSQFETIIWTTENPADLTLARSEALVEWVRRGGHLVVVLPSTGQVWFDEERNRLAELLPEITPERLEPGTSNVRALLTHNASIEMPESLVVHALDASASAGPTDAMPILTDAEGRTVVSRRLVDLGMVTLIGIDITNRNLADRGLPAMDAFWHRVLGRRGKPIDRTQQQGGIVLSRDVRHFDNGLGSAIASSGSAGLALLLGFVLFAVYWAVGGPLGYAVLNQFSQKKHSWIAFVAAIGVFTLIGWGTVSILRPRTPSLQQVAFLDAVHGSNFQRVRSFASIFVPGYADAGVRVGEPDATFTEFNNAITHWDPQFVSTVAAGGFPDARAYPVSARDPELMRFPARATEKRLRMEWVGPSNWPMPQPIDAQGRSGELRLDASGDPMGFLTHQQPGPLRNTVILVVKRQRFIGTETGLPVISHFDAYKLADPWPAGATLDLSNLLPEDESPRAREALQRYFDDLISRASGGGIVSTGGATPDALIGAGFVSQLAPPHEDGSRGNRDAGLRRNTHGLDLGKWLTQPCVMVLGTVSVNEEDRVTNPVPTLLQRTGEWDDVDWSGTVVVRWVYPLAPNPPEWSSDAAREVIVPPGADAANEGLN